MAISMRGGWAAACLLGLGSAACDREPAAPATVNVGPVPPMAGEVDEYPDPSDPDCAPSGEGRYSSFGNRWVRYGHVCIDQVEVSFEAFPDPSVGYSIQSDRCPSLRHFSRFRTPEKFFETPVTQQIRVFKDAIGADLREFARQCGIRIDPSPFVDERFDRFYLDYGDGWWFDRLDGGIVLTPDVRSGEPRASAR